MGSVHSAFRGVAILVAAAQCLSLSAKAADRIIFSDGTNTVAPARPSLNTDDIARRLNSGRSGAPEIQESFAPSSPSIQPVNPDLSRKLESYLDRKKNWMFHSDSDPLKKQDPFGVSGSSQESKNNSFGNKRRWDVEGDDKTESSPKERSKKQNGPDDINPSRDNDTNPTPGRDRQSDRRAAERLTERTVQDYLNPAGKSFLTDSRFGDRGAVLKGFDKIGVPSSFSQLDPAKRAEKELEQKTHDTEFLQMLQPRTSIGSTISVLEPVGESRDLNRQTVHPFAPPSLVKSSESSRANPLGTAGSLSSVTTYPSDASTVGSGIGAGLGAGVQLPVVQKPSSVFSTTVSTFKSPQKPFVLEFPKRQF